MKPKQCPQCGKRSIASILRGMPDYSPALQRKLDKGQVVLGGCILSADNQDPEWHCNTCEYEW